MSLRLAREITGADRKHNKQRQRGGRDNIYTERTN